MNWFLTRDQRARLKTLARLNRSLSQTQDHILDLLSSWNASAPLERAMLRAQHIVETIRLVAQEKDAP